MKTFYIITREDTSGDTIKVAAVEDGMDAAKNAMDQDVFNFTAQNSDQVDRFVLTKITGDDQDMDALLDMSEDKRLSTVQQQEFKDIMRNSVKQILTIFTVRDMLEAAMQSDFYALATMTNQDMHEFFMQTVTPFGGRYRT